ncbi:hypothetical protein RGUI_3879 [Rhodovulum sp. P5]|nr:hypothetical protein RGUI_3879 [Rhodovulum sp. P5]
MRHGLASCFARFKCRKLRAFQTLSNLVIHGGSPQSLTWVNSPG